MYNIILNSEYESMIILKQSEIATMGQPWLYENDN